MGKFPLIKEDEEPEVLELSDLIARMRDEYDDDCLCLDLGSGNRLNSGFKGVDLYHPDADYKVDLSRGDWPFEDDSVSMIYSSHFVEHLPQDSWETFWKEVYRICKNGAKVVIRAPHARSDWGLQDPTHKMFVTPNTFAYLSRDWREENEVDHYLLDVDIVHFMNAWFNWSDHIAALSESAKYDALLREWNACNEFVVFMQVQKGEKENG